MVINDIIDYIEITVCENNSETIGLLTHFGANSKQLSLKVDDIHEELFQLGYYTITRIIVVKTSINEVKEDQYIFKMDDKDQETAYKIICNHMSMLESEGRCTVSGYIDKNTFTDIPKRYIEKEKKSSTVNIKKATTVGNTGISDTSGVTRKEMVHNYNNNYAKRNTKTVSFLKRESKLPSKAFLKAMKAKVAEVTAETFKQTFPFMENEKPDTNLTQAEKDAAMAEIYGPGAHYVHGDY